MKKSQFIRLKNKNTEDIKRMFCNFKKRIDEISQELDDLKIKQINEQLRDKTQ